MNHNSHTAYHHIWFKCWAPTTTLLCSIFLPVLVRAIPCIGTDMGMCTVAYASLMVELQQDGYNSKTRESRLFEKNRAIRFVRLGTDHYLAVLYFPASACKSHPMYQVRTWECVLKHMYHSRWSYNKTATHQRWESPDFSRATKLLLIRMFGWQSLPCYALFSFQCLSKPSHV